jgi:hypothetical protein
MAYTLRPLTLGELLDRTFLFYRQHFALFVGVTALPNLLSLMFGLALVVTRSRASGPGSVLISALAASVVFLVTAVFTQAATVVVVSQIQLAKPTGILDAFRSIRPRLAELVVLTLNMGVRIALGFLLLIVPGILLSLRYALAIPVAILEWSSGSESLLRSADLTRGHRGRILLVYILFFVMSTIVNLLWQLPSRLLFGAVRGVSQAMTAQIAAQFFSFATQALIGPVATIAFTLLYYDVRVRKEAFDLEHMMRQLDERVPDGPATT